jgi:6-pyruvoyltetrahydropterin/6-carboxytetrahydropterin synthase
MMGENIIKIHVSVDDYFCAAHQFNDLPESMPESRLHGHTWRVRATWAGEINGLGVVQEASVLKAILSELIRPLRHTLLNSVDGLTHITSEGIALWLFTRLAVTNAGTAQLVGVEVWRDQEGIKAAVYA